MNALVEYPRSRVAEWRFRLLGVEVAVKFWFWLAVAITCPAGDTPGVLIWVAVCLGSILAHEMGHVMAFRQIGENADVVLYGWGGLTIPFHRVYGVQPAVRTSLAGPATSLAIAAAAWLLARVLGPNVLLLDLVGVNVAWALLNLLPVYPLDGWRVSSAVLPPRKALMLSAAVAGAMAVAGLFMRSAVVGLGFAVLAVSSLQGAEERG